MRGTVRNLLIGSALCIGISPLTGSADNVKSPGINAREHNQQVRINQGIKSGQITRPEAKKLEAQEAKIKVNEKFDKKDGNLSPKERTQLNKELDHSSRSIYRDKHNNQVQK